METREPDRDSAETVEVRTAHRPWWANEDWLAVALGLALLAISLIAVILDSGVLSAARGDTAAAESAWSNPFKPWLAQPGSWVDDPRDAFRTSEGQSRWGAILGAFAASGIAFAIGCRALGVRFWSFLPGFLLLFLLATFAYVLAGQEVIEHYNLEYALWALAVGMLISHTIGTPRWVRPALRTEFYIKTGLVLLGAEVLISKLLMLGLPGIFISWVVTPIVLIVTYWFGQRVIGIESRSLNMVISADMSVCGVSAAIATAAACKAKKEELSLAIGISLTFTVIMMVVMPAVIRLMGINQVLAGAWIGGTIDSTGAVAAAGGLIGETALQVAAAIKMIQNILIGVIAFGVSVYWVTYVERDGDASRPQAIEIWRRFPKFVLGFVAASLLFSLLYSSRPDGPQLVGAVIDGSTKTLRAWFFCVAFVSIGLETNFRQLARYLQGGKPLLLYVCGQTLNLCLTLAMAWLMFEKVFPHAVEALSP